MKGTFGRFVEGSSFLHQMDARAKIIGVTLYTIILFFSNNVSTYVLLVLGTFGIFSLTGVSLRYIFGSMKFILYLVLFAFVLHLFTTKTGVVLFDFGFIRIYTDAIVQGFYIGLRLILLMGLSSILTITTTPIQITDGLEALFSPFQKLGLPVHEMALMLSLALRFIPTLSDEMEKVSKAQAARGLDVKARKIPLKQKIKAGTALLVPLFVHAFRRADELAMAMEARGYEQGRSRTKVRGFTWHIKDTLAIICVILFGIVLWVLRT